MYKMRDKTPYKVYDRKPIDPIKKLDGLEHKVDIMESSNSKSNQIS